MGVGKLPYMLCLMLINGWNECRELINVLDAFTPLCTSSGLLHLFEQGMAIWQTWVWNMVVVLYISHPLHKYTKKGCLFEKMCLVGYFFAWNRNPIIFTYCHIFTQSKTEIIASVCQFFCVCYWTNIQSWNVLNSKTFVVVSSSVCTFGLRFTELYY